jgi:hypothetical protein
MEWYEIIIAIAVFFVGAFIGIKVNEINKNKYHNDSGGIGKNRDAEASFFIQKT